MILRGENEVIKILFVIHDLSVGGAEKVLVNLVNNMDYKKFDVTILSLFDVGVNKQFLNPHVKYRYAFKKAIRGNSHLMKLLSPQQLYKQLIPKGYDIVVSYLEGTTARIVGGCSDKRVKIVSWIHYAIRDRKELCLGFRGIKEAVKCYNRADEIVFVSQDVKQAFLDLCPIDVNTTVLYNTNESEKIITKASETVENFKFDNKKFYWCGVGKVIPNKGFDRMIHIQKRLLSEGYHSHLLILGTGWQQEELKCWCENNGIADTVSFLGYQTNPYKYVSKCNLFVCASHGEGFSTATTEALIVGTPVCTVNVSGMREMLGDNNEYGMIVENNEDALYKRIKSLLDDISLLQYYREQAIIRGKSFSTEETVKKVENMLSGLVEV